MAVARAMAIVALLVAVLALDAGVVKARQHGGAIPDQNDLYCGELDCYATLGLDQEDRTSLTTRQIKKAYRKKAIVHHPDKAPPSEKEVRYEYKYSTGIDYALCVHTIIDCDRLG